MNQPRVMRKNDIQSFVALTSAITWSVGTVELETAVRARARRRVAVEGDDEVGSAGSAGMAQKPSELSYEAPGLARRKKPYWMRVTPRPARLPNLF